MKYFIPIQFHPNVVVYQRMSDFIEVTDSSNSRNFDCIILQRRKRSTNHSMMKIE